MKPRTRNAAAHKRHRKRTANAVHSRSNGSVVIQITTTHKLAELLDRVADTGFFGTSRSAAAERLLAEALRNQLREGTIQRRRKAIEEES